MGLILAAAGGCSSDTQEKKPENEFLKSLNKDAKKIAAEAKQQRQAEEAEQQRREEMLEAKQAEQREAVQEAYQRRLQQSESGTTTRQSAAQPEVEYTMSAEDEKMFKRIILGKIQQASDGAPISMSFDEGVVTLYGEVESRQVRQRIVDELKSLPGILKVNVDQLVVKGQ
jgi:hypothetical protein